MFFPSPFTGLAGTAAAAINHLLAQEAWARDSLALHAGKEALVDAGAFSVRLRVARDGMVQASNTEAPASVTIRVKVSDVPLILQNRDRAFSYVKIEGDAEFANAISQLSKALRWEAEHDLEPFLGPIGARRVVGGARSVAEGVRTTHRKLTENMAEFLVEERPVLVHRHAAEAFGEDVRELRDDVERAAKRIAKLEQKLAKPAPRAGQQHLDLE
ncbi:SCP2 domain-containing protein [Pseudoduganella sp. GCM10020061]|uniref:ubiquinone biosynthesis accessory factor UbiJ n=1 Tax=Pseudoduganella sp. GCM10020061 TaxID=3317345 RepID=UPI003633792D